MLSAFLNLLLPPLCPICAGYTATGGLCPKCNAGIRFITGSLCICCGMPFISQETSNHFCSRCIRKKKPFSRARSVAVYEGILMEAIHWFKYNGKTSLAKPLGQLLTKGFSNPGYDLIVPVPLHRTRIKERGFNQALLLARELAETYSLPVDYIRLKRIRPTDPQTGLKGKERMKNVRGAFAVEYGRFFEDKNVLLIDDVYTTGATVSECCRVLKKAGAKNTDVLTLARVASL